MLRPLLLIVRTAVRAMLAIASVAAKLRLLRGGAIGGGEGAGIDLLHRTARRVLLAVRVVRYSTGAAHASRTLQIGNTHAKLIGPAVTETVT